jgi:DNA-binding CsgD family transcriptional regulator
MSRPVDALDQIAKSGDAVFALDGNDLVILWNKHCEELLGRPAYEVLGRRCYDVMCGRDIYGNMYCCPSCPISRQARTDSEDPVARFELDVPTTGGGKKRLAITTFAIRGARSSPTTLVHVLREPGTEASPLEHELAAAVSDRPAPRSPARAPDGQLARLTKREQEILGKMAQGLTTSVIADQMFISPVTVRNHIAKILQKLDVHTKLAAVAFAYRNGLVQSESQGLPVQGARATSPTETPLQAAARRGNRPLKANTRSNRTPRPGGRGAKG